MNDVEKTRRTQKAMILEWLRSGKPITPREADDLCGCTRLAAVICDLRKAGYEIETRNCTARNKIGGISNYAKYILIKEPFR